MLGYRADIDGLRAVAVLSVLFFHIDLNLFSGGFVGVDVFFTISGFLITSILLKEQQAGSFSFRRFYIRRALRLLPAYLILVLLTTLIGFVILAPIAFKELLESTIASSLFASNFYFLFTLGGYFSSAAHELPLLHTWSLSVEEQFYLLMPLAVVLWFKIKSESKRLWALFIIFLLSVLVSIILTDIHQKSAYFVVFSRAHEFLIGSILAVLLIKFGKNLTPSRTLSNGIFILAGVMLICSTVFITAKSAFPGYLALIPCIATILIIYSGLNQKCISHKVLGNRCMAFIGLLSYSLYLYHWPIVSYAKYVGIEFTTGVQVAIVLMSFICAYLSWRYIENKVRYSQGVTKNITAPVLYVVPSVCLVVLYIYSKGMDFYPNRFDEKVVAMEQMIASKPEEGRETCHTSSLIIDSSPKCKFGAVNSYSDTAILWGDSHANHFVGFVDELGKKYHTQVQDITMGNCPPLPNVYIAAQGAGKTCIEKNNKVLKYVLEQKPDTVFLAGSWAGYLEHYIKANNQQEKIEKVVKSLSELIIKLHENSIKVTFFEMLPRTPSHMSSCYLKHSLYPSINSIDKCQFSPLEFFYEEQTAIYQRLKSQFGAELTMITMNDLICESNTCKPYVNNIPLYRDNNHLNLQGSRLLGQIYLNEFVN